MTTTATLSIAYDIKQSGTELWFRKATLPGNDWHGPYADVEDLAEAICFYSREHLLETFEPMPWDDDEGLT